MNTLLLVSLLVSSILTGSNPNQMQVNRTSSEEPNASVHATFEEQQEAILQFINVDVARVSSYEMEAFDSLAKVSGENYTDDETMYLELVENTIPAYEKALAEVKNIEVQGQELEEMKKRLLVATETFYEAILLQKQALEQQSEELMVESNFKLEEYIQLVDAYHLELELLSLKYKVEYERNDENTEKSDESFI
ncbi:hypothetical protein AWM68_11525 [Fictibacillus phosphorivorans]|uniref:Uncharacterized protein n=1 Tax=Fictibacillus phosphorivorans TaxID=1221500 RepID=A0A163PMI2_9BACL|nr:hypothetical protein [Fictibacillus phosphorivorans]KZE63738.1 hypothetical protein AWM68_11525 [Fictibacillus phosphorivorans]